jgi:hypothetical protein
VATGGLVDITTVEPDPAKREFNGSLLVNGFAYELFEAQDLFTLEVLWDVQSPIERDYIAMLHVYDDAGVLVTQDDFQPELPTRYWQYGEDFRLDYVVLAPEAGWRPGTYHLHLGWYEREEPYTRMALTLVEGQPTTYLLFSFEVDAEGNLVLPEFEIVDEATEEALMGAPEAPSPEASREVVPEETQEAEAEFTEEAAPETEATEAEASEEVTAEATAE